MYIPSNLNKVIMLNEKGGLFYRSGLEHKMMIYLDHSDKVVRWGAEFFSVPYQKTEWVAEKQSYRTTTHKYYPDFYYEIIKEDGSIEKVVAEVKPKSETVAPKLPEKATPRQMKNFEYALKMFNKNISKWQKMIEFCKSANVRFIIITEDHLK